MAFDPTKPVEGSEIDTAELRNQFNALQEQIAALLNQLGCFIPQQNDATFSGLMII